MTDAAISPSIKFASGADMSNRLPVLAAEIRRAHADMFAAAKTAAEHAISAGKALIEAKGLLKHGEWLPWLREHCALAERTAQVYMQIAKTGLSADVVAEIGLKAAAKVDWVLYDPGYDPFANCDERQKLEWHIFQLHLVRECGWHPDGAWAHIEWLLQKQFATVDEWLGPEGEQFRARCFFTPSGPNPGFASAWTAFRDLHSGRDLVDVVDELNRLSKEAGPPKPLGRRSRRRPNKQSSNA